MPFFKFKDDRVIVGVVTNNEEMAWGEEVVRLAPWCKDNFLILNTKNTKAVKGNGHWPQEKTIHRREIHINQEKCRYLRTWLRVQPQWSWWGRHSSTNVSSELWDTSNSKRTSWKKIHCYTIQSFLTYYFTVWYTSCTAEEWKDLQQVVKRSQWIIVTIHFTAWSLIFLYSIYLCDFKLLSS